MKKHSTKHTIAFLISSSFLGGAEINALRIIKHLNKDLFSPVAIITKKGPLEKKIKELNIPYFISIWPHHFGTLSGIEKLILKNRIKYFFKKENIRLIHNNSMLSLDTALWLEKEFKIPIITQWHDDRIPEIQAKLLQKNLTTPIITVSNAVKSTILQAIPNLKNIQTVYNGIDNNLFSKKINQFDKKQMGIHENDFLLGCFSRLTEGKGLELLIKIISKLPKNIKCIIAGYWENDLYKSKIRSLISEYRIENRLIIMDFQDNIGPLINFIDLLVLSSSTEAFPLIILESLSASKPVICHKLGGMPEQVAHNKEGFLIDYNDIESWIHHIKLISQNKEMYNMFSKNALKKSKEFSIEKSITAIEKTYLERLPLSS